MLILLSSQLNWLIHLGFFVQISRTKMAVNFKMVDNAKDFVTKLFKEKLSENYLYHNFTHTKEVADTCLEIAEQSKLADDEIEILLLAAWFHDTGYIFSTVDHEEKSVQVMKAYLEGQNYNEEKINNISNLILSTENSREPQNIKEKIIKDADLAHIGKEKFDDKGELLRGEWELLFNRIYSDLEWQKIQLDFLNKKKFYTEYAKKKFGERLRKNILEKKGKVELALKNSD